MKRLYDALVQSHLETYQEMLFLSGPRQVGKTTVSKHMKELADHFTYLNWDNEDHRQTLMSELSVIAELTRCNTLSNTKPIVVFDEIHKRPNWKNFLKGFYDTYAQNIRILVTGSARLDLYKKGGDSLMGRYFPYRIHPLSVAECIRTEPLDIEVTTPSPISDDDYQTLLSFGGFPKPFMQRSQQFSTRWKNLRKQQLIQEDIRDINVIHDLNRLQLLMDILKEQAAKQITYSSLSKLVRVSVDTITRWIEVLETFYYCYRVRPWSRNITRSLIKEPKIFLWDWSLITDTGAKAENFIGSHLLKATQYWTDRGLGEYELFYIRTLDKKEVDFVVSKNGQAWFLVEVKQSNNQPISPHLAEFQKQSGATHAFQVVINSPYVDKNCFSSQEPIIVPARTFLSQLV